MLNLPQTHKWDIARVSHSTLVNADCFDVFPFISDKSVDAIIADLPYGTTQNKWDSVLPLDKLWNEYKRILKDNGVIILTASQPFTSVLVVSNLKMFKHEWIWNKNRGSNFANTVREPMKEHESVLVFANKKWTYNKQMEQRKGSGADRVKYIVNPSTETTNYGDLSNKQPTKYGELRVPSSVQKFNTDTSGEHPTIKPLGLFEYLIKTYTNENEIVLDNTMGSGTTGLACLKTNRQFIGIEKEKQYYDVAVRRLSSYCA
jgi:site-specific DNA-methyltransferase (adenine-specific)